MNKDGQLIRRFVDQKYPLTLEYEFGMLHPRGVDFIESLSLETDELNAVVHIAEQVWLKEFVVSVAGNFRLIDGEGIFLVTDVDEIVSNSFLQMAHQLRHSIFEFVKSEFGVHIDRAETDTIFLFKNNKDYISYTTHYIPEGEHAASGGMCIRENLVCHIAMPYSKWDLEVVLAHEMSHVALMGEGLPLWLEEGIVQVIQYALFPKAFDARPVDNFSLRATKRYWKLNGMSSFWNGEAFFDLNGQEHAYLTSEIIVRYLVNDYKKQVIDFIQNANYVDGGKAAASSVLGMDLNELSDKFLT